MDESVTLQKILEAAREEFLAKGFQSASLRNIVKTAGVTTGAFYGYYKSKEELFDALVGGQYEYVINRYKEAHESFARLPIEEQPAQLGKRSEGCMNDILLHAFEHKEEYRLLLQCSDGTRYSRMIDDMVEIEVEATHKFYRVLEKLGSPAPKIDRRLEHILATGLLNAYFEMIIHDMPLEDAKLYFQELCDFYTAGWVKIMGQ